MNTEWAHPKPLVFPGARVLGLGSCIGILPWLTAAKTGKATNVMMAGGFAQVATIAGVALNLQNFIQELEALSTRGNKGIFSHTKPVKRQVTNKGNTYL